jgi:hypothetical protein
LETGELDDDSLDEGGVDEEGVIEEEGLTEEEGTTEEEGVTEEEDGTEEVSPQATRNKAVIVDKVRICFLFIMVLLFDE